MSLFKKLTTIQNKVEVPKSQYNKFGNYYYRNVEDIQSGVKPFLEALELTLNVSDELHMIGDRFYVKATATITDGENSISNSAFARESLNKKGMDDSMCTATASSYARKYALGGLFLLDDLKDADNADNRESGKTENKDADMEKPWFNQPHFDSMLPKFTEAIRAGDKTGESIIARLSQDWKINKEIRNKIMEIK